MSVVTTLKELWEVCFIPELFEIYIYKESCDRNCEACREIGCHNIPKKQTVFTTFLFQIFEDGIKIIEEDHELKRMFKKISKNEKELCDIIEKILDDDNVNDIYEGILDKKTLHPSYIIDIDKPIPPLSYNPLVDTVQQMSPRWED